MFKFTTNHIFIGYIKQVLAAFNLPKYRVYTKENQQYFDKYKKELYIIESETDSADGKHARVVPYIKNDEVQKYVAGAWENLALDYYDKRDANNTKTLEVKNNIYDRYTHEYLGDFLRFLRDYDNLNLMPLYNCFGNTLADRLKLTGSHVTNKDGAIQKSFAFNSYDSNYKIYMLPVKLFKNYTVALECDSEVELCCGIYGAYKDPDATFDELSCSTYIKINRPAFNKPFLFKNLTEMTAWLDKSLQVGVAQNEQDLKLFIKLPTKTKTSIVVLEGDYLNWNDRILRADNTSTDANHIVINFETDSKHPDFEDRTFKPTTALQLLMLNTGESYPFADRLIEYLTDNAITNRDALSDNIKRIQKIIAENHAGYKSTVMEVDGLWSAKMQQILYSFMYDFKNNNIQMPSNVCHDILGFGDKDVEQYYKSKRGTKTINTMKDVDLYEDIYKANKKTSN